MRPLAVLLLVIAAVAALMFALVASDAEPRQAETVATTAQPERGQAAPRPATDLQAPTRTEAPTAVEVEPAEREAAGRPESGAFRNRLHGTVKGPAGQAVAGAELTLDKSGLPGGVNAFAALFGDGGASEGPTWRTTSDPNGEYEIRNIEPGSGYTLVVRSGRFSSAEVPFIDIPTEGDVRENIELGEGFLVHGYVRNEAAQPVAGATLVLGTLPLLAGLPQREDPERREATSDGRGYYRFENATPGTRTLTVSATGYGSQTKNQVVVGGKPSTEQDFRLTPGLSVAGRVVGPNQQPIVGATVEALMYKAELTSRGTTATVEDGEFVIEDLSEGQYQLVVSADGWGTERVNRVEAGQTDVVVTLHEQGGVEGRVVDGAGRPVTSFTCTVRFVNAQTNVYGRGAKTAKFSGRSDGSFHVEGLEQGTYAVQASAPGFAPSYSEVFSIAQGQLTPNVEVRMIEGGTLRGIVLDAATGQPIPDAQVVTNENNWIDSPFTQLLGSTMARNTTLQKVRTNAKGEFVLKQLAPHTYQVKITHPDHTAHIANDLSVTDGVNYDMGPIRLQAGAVVTGTVYDAAGRPLPGAQISITPTTPSAHNQARFYQGRSGSDGKYVLRNVAPGDYKVSAARPAGVAGRTGSPFDSIIDMKNSEIQVSISEGGSSVHDLYLGE